MYYVQHVLRFICFMALYQLLKYRSLAAVWATSLSVTLSVSSNRSSAADFGWKQTPTEDEKHREDSEIQPKQHSCVPHN